MSEYDESEIQELKEVSEKKFRINVRKGKFILTYKSHVPKDLYRDWFDSKGKQGKLFISHENGDETNPYEHSHIMIIYDVDLQTTNCRYFDFMDIHPNIKQIKTNL